jgi:hypothetical protein
MDSNKSKNEESIELLSSRSLAESKLDKPHKTDGASGQTQAFWLLIWMAK